MKIMKLKVNEEERLLDFCGLGDNAETSPECARFKSKDWELEWDRIEGLYMNKLKELRSATLDK